MLDTRTGRLLPVPGSTVDAELGLGLGWSSSGAGDAWLLLSMPRTVHAQGQVGAWQLAAWRPGDPRLRVPARGFQPATRQPFDEHRAVRDDLALLRQLGAFPGQPG